MSIFKCLACWLITSVIASAVVARPDPFSANTVNDTFSEQTFLPVEEAYQMAAEFDSEGSLHLIWQIADGYYLYRHGFSADITANGETRAIELAIPPGKEKIDDYFGKVQVYYLQAEATASNFPDQGSLQLAVTSQGCADAGLCYPPHTEILNINRDNGVIDAVTDSAAGTPASSTATPLPPGDGQKAPTLPLMLLFAFLGGVILNLMPCVFPVLSLKVLSFTADRQHSHTIHGLVYTAGVVISFVVVAGTLVSLRAAGSAIGWGFHLQSPWFVAALAYLFFVMALSLSGVINIGGSWMGMGNRLSAAPGYSGSFFTGVLATVVASPCTAPFMGTALGFAISQPTVVALTVFVALGLGMAAPVLILSCSPALLKFMPRPGVWMENFKELMAFPLYATVIWLAWVVGNQAGATGMAMVLSGCLLIGLALWFWSHHILRRGLSLAAAIIAIWLLTSPLLTPTSTRPVTDGIVSYDSTVLEDLRQRQQRVFVDVTADWCITCLANERLTLSTDKVQQAFRNAGIVYMKADWTNQDPGITALLQQYQRSGIPLYLMFPADPTKPAVVLPQILTVNLVLDAIGETESAASSTNIALTSHNN